MLERANVNKAIRAVHAAGSDACISTLTGHQMIYFGTKEKLDLNVMRGYQADFKMLSLESQDFDWAYTNTRNANFEDALQLAVAIRHGCREFITFDRQLATTYASLLQLTIHYLGE